VLWIQICMDPFKKATLDPDLDLHERCGLRIRIQQVFKFSISSLLVEKRNKKGEKTYFGCKISSVGDLNDFFRIRIRILVFRPIRIRIRL